MPSTFISFIHQRNYSNQSPVAEVDSFTIKLDTDQQASAIVSYLPQGSLLGPLPFSIFVNDINHSAGSSSLRFYADDTTQYTAYESPFTLESTLNQDMERLTRLFNANCY